MLQNGNFRAVGRWMRAMGQKVRSEPDTLMVDPGEAELRKRLCREEVEELCDAIDADNLKEIADAIGDILYVVYGTAHTYGIDADRVFWYVHLSNITKLDPDTLKPILDEGGKVLKPETFQLPQIDLALLTQMPIDLDTQQQDGQERKDFI